MGGDPFRTLYAGQRPADPFAAYELPDEEAVAPPSASTALAVRPRTYLPPPRSTHHTGLRAGWDILSSPLRGLAGLTGTSLVQLLGIRALAPEAYRKAAEENQAGEVDRAGPDFLNEASALPGFGDVAAAAVPDELKETTAGKILTPVGRLAGNILGDPSTYLGAGLITRATKVGRVASELGQAQKAVATLTKAGKAEEAAALTSRIPALAGALAEAVGSESAVGRGARSILEGVESLGTHGATGRAVKDVGMSPSFAAAVRGVGRVGATLPFSPIVGLAYAPELAEGVVNQGGDAIENARAGRYAEAAASGTGALLTAGLGILVGKGALDEARAAGVLERSIAEQLGEKDRAMPKVAPAAPAEAAPVAGRAGEGAAAQPSVAPAPGTGNTTIGQPPTPEGGAAGAPPVPPAAEGGGAAAAPEPPPLTPTPGSERIKIKAAPDASDRLAAVVQGKSAEGQYLTKRDLLEAGLITPKQAKTYSLPQLLDALPGGMQVRAQLEPVAGYGFRLKQEAPESVKTNAQGPAVGGGAETQPGAPAAPAPAAEAAPGPTAVPASATAVVPPGGAAPGPAPVPAKLTRAEIDKQLENPELRSKVGEALGMVSQHVGVPLLSMDKTHIAAAFPGDENKATRALLYRSLEAQKKIARETPSAAAAGPANEPSASLTNYPGNVSPRDFDEPRRTPAHILAESRERPPQGGLVGKAREATGIGEPMVPAKAVYDINTQGELDAARAELRRLKVHVMAHPEHLAEMSDDIVKLEDDVLEAVHRGVGTPDMEQPARQPRPEPAPPREVMTEPPTDRPYLVRERQAERTKPREFYKERYEPPTPEGTPHATRRAIENLLAESDIPADKFFDRAEQLLGKSLDDATGDELNLVLTMAERQPAAFGAKEKPSPYDPQLTRQALGRLVGGLEHTSKIERGEGFSYDPASPAGKVQEYARALEATHGVPAEQNLQDTLSKLLIGLGQDDERFPRMASNRIVARLESMATKANALEAAGKGAEAGALRDQAAELAKKAPEMMDRAKAKTKTAQNLRRLLLSNDGDPTKELTKYLKSSLTNDARDFYKRETKRSKPIDNLIAGEGLSQAEKERLSVRPEVEALPEAPEGKTYKIDHPARPDGVTPAEWREQVRVDPELRQAHLESLAAVVQAEKKGNVGKGGSATGKVLKQMATDLGVEIPAKANSEKIIKRIVRALGLKEPSAASVSDLLTDQLVSQRGELWDKAVQKGERIGKTDAKVVDFEGDAPMLTKKFAQVAEPLVDPLSRATQDIATTVDLPATFGGFTASPQLAGTRMADGSIYLNALHARHSAEAEVAAMEEAGRGLNPESRQRLVEEKTARNIVDLLSHEIAHRAARSHEGEDFIRAYAQAIKDLGPQYMGMVRSVRDEVTPLYKQMTPLVQEYSASVSKLQEVIRGGGEGQPGSAVRPDVGAGAGGTATEGRGPGGGAGGAAGGAQPGVRPIRPIPPGGAGAAEGLRAGAAADQGAAGVAVGERGTGTGPGAGGGAEPSASLTSDLTTALQKRKNDQTIQIIQHNFARNMARSAGTPEDADRYIKELDEIRKLPEEARQRLMTAKPQGAVDVGFNLHKVAGLLTDEQREQIGLALAMRNHMFSRAEPVTPEMRRAELARLIENHTPEEFIDMAKVKGLKDPAEFAFLRAAVTTFGQDLDKAHADLRAATISKDAAGIEAAREAMGTAWAKREAGLNALIPETTRVARVLASLRSMAEPLTSEETFKSRFFGAMRASGIKKDKTEQFYKMLQDTIAQGPGGDWTRFVNAFREATKPKLFDKFLEFWKAGLLGIPTQITNIGTNAGFLGLRNAEMAVSRLANNFFSGLTGAPKTRFVGESAARLRGGGVGFREAWDGLKYDLKDIAALRPPDPGERLKRGTAFDDLNIRQLYGAIEGKKGEFVRIPFKLLDSFDNFFKHIIRNQEWASQAHRLANNPILRTGGEAVTHASARIYDELRTLARDPIANQNLWKKPGYQEAVQAGHDASVKDTFQEALAGTPLRDAAKKYQEATNKLPALQLVTPFFKTPYNILAEAMKRTPVAAAWTIKKYMAGEIDNPRFVEDMVKSAMGTALMATVFQHALDGTITGGGPADPKEAEMLKRTGWQPRSIKMGNNYYSYARLAPFSILMGIAADMAEAYDKKDISTGSELLQKGVASASDNVFDQSFVTGLDSVMKILTDPQRQGLGALRQLEASLVPNVVGVVPVAHLARGVDPYYRETEAMSLSPIQAQIPGLSRYLPPQYTPTGEPRERKGTPLERIFSPIARSEVQTGPVAEAAAEIARVGPALSAPPPYYRVGNEKIYYSQEEREEIALAQNKAMEKVASLIQRGDYQRLPESEDLAHANAKTKKDAITGVIQRYVQPVRERVNRRALQRARSEA